MSVLHIKLQNAHLVKHYQKGMQRLLELPIKFGEDCSQNKHNEFFAYLSTLGGGLVGGDSYFQCFEVENTKATLQSQSNQKIYKGASTLNTKIKVDDNSILVFHNDANIFYKNSDFKSKACVFAQENSKLFYLDGGYLGYANGDFKASMLFRLYINNKLALNDVFSYEDKTNLLSLYSYEYFYTIIIRANIQIESLHNDEIIMHTSTINDNQIVRILAKDNDIALKHINKIKLKFLQGVDMNVVITR